MDDFVLSRTYFSFYTAVISPPISPLKAAALWGAPPVHQACQPTPSQALSHQGNPCVTV